MLPQMPLSFVSNRIPTDNDKIVVANKHTESLPPIKYKVVETVNNMEDDSIDEDSCHCKNKMLRQDLLSLDKNILEIYGVALDSDQVGQQASRTA